MSDVPGSITSFHSDQVPSINNLSNEDMSLDIHQSVEEEQDPVDPPNQAGITDNIWNLIPAFEKSSIKKFEFAGSGSQGICYKIYLKNVGTCAWKQEQPTTRNARYIERERIYASALNHHPCILPFYGLMFDGSWDNYVGIVMENMPGGSLTEWFRQHRPVGREIFAQKVKWAKQIALAVSYMHQRNIIHRDICPSNILLTQVELPNSAKLGDLGLAREVDNVMTVNVGHKLYMAPEMIENRTGSYDFSADVFSFAMTLYTIFSEKIPFEEEGSERWTSIPIKNRLLGANPALSARPHLPKEWGSISNLIEHCWKTDPHDRFTMEEVCAFLEENYGFE